MYVINAIDSAALWHETVIFFMHLMMQILKRKKETINTEKEEKTRN